MEKLMGSLLLFSAATAWGTTFVVSKFILDSIPVFTILLGRYLIAFLVLLTIVVCRREKPIKKEHLPILMKAGFVGYFGSVAIQYIGMKYTDAHIAAIMNSTSTVFIMILAVPMLKEKMNLKKALASVVAVAGVLLIIGVQMQPNKGLLSSVLLIIAAFTWALGTIYLKKATDNYSAILVNTYAIFIAILFILPFSLREMYLAQSIFYDNSTKLLSMLYLGVVSTAFAYVAWNKGIALIGAVSGSLFYFFQPLSAAYFGWLILGESLKWNFYLGGLLIIISILMITFEGKTLSSNDAKIPLPK